MKPRLDQCLSILKKLVLAYLITAVLLMLLSMLLYKLQLQEKTVRIGIIFIYAVSCFAAGFIAGKSAEKKQFIWGLLTGVLYFAVLAIVSILIKQSFEAVSGRFATTFLICAGSGMLGGMLS